jgi:hypothetical protein
MRDLHFITRAYEFTAIPKAGAGFCGKNINGAGDGANDPALILFIFLYCILI